MSQNDSLIETGMNHLNPVPVPQTGTDERAERELAQLIDGQKTNVRDATSHESSRARGSWMKWGLAAASALAVGGIVISSLVGGSTNAIASAPPALAVQHVDASKQTVLNGLLKAAKRQSGTTARTDPFTYEWWEEGVSPEGGAIIVPVTSTVKIAADGSRTMEQTAGQPFDQFKGKVDYRDPGGEKVVPGEKTTFTIAANEYPDSLLTPGLATTRGELKTQLKRATVENAMMFSNTPAGHIDALGWAILESPISIESERAIIGYLADDPAIKLQGKVKDRMGREGYMFAAAASAEDGSDAFFPGSSAVILDEDTGELISYEKTRSDDGTTAPVVERYIARK